MTPGSLELSVTNLLTLGMLLVLFLRPNEMPSLGKDEVQSKNTTSKQSKKCPEH